MPKVLVTAPGVTGPNDPRLQPLVDAGWQIRTHRWPGGRPAEEDVVELVQGNDAVIASASERYTPAVISRADTLKHIADGKVSFLASDRCDALRSFTPRATSGATAAIATARTNHGHPHRRPDIAAKLLPRGAAIASPPRFPLIFRLMAEAPRRITGH